MKAVSNDVLTADYNLIRNQRDELLEMQKSDLSNLEGWKQVETRQFLYFEIGRMNDELNRINRMLRKF